MLKNIPVFILVFIIFSCNKKGINKQLVEEYLNSKFEIKNIVIKLINRENN